jgi:hypothetical protein
VVHEVNHEDEEISPRTIPPQKSAGRYSTMSATIDSDNKKLISSNR